MLNKKVAGNFDLKPKFTLMKNFLLLLFCFTTLGVYAQLSAPGDIAFTAFNADGNDDFALVTFKDIPVNTSVYFSDKEWTGTAFNTGEESWEWNSGATVIPAGTVIIFNDISDNSRTVTAGNYAGATDPGGVSASSEAIFAYLGTDVDTPTTFLAAVANNSGAFGTLTGTGLSLNLTAVAYPASTDIAAYNGVRTGLGVGGYLAELNDIANFDIQAGSGDQGTDGTVPDLPFNNTSFVISTTDVTPPFVTGVEVQNATTLTIRVSESVTMTSATSFANFSLDNGLTLSNVAYDDSNLEITITHSGFVVGQDYTLIVTGLEDTAANVQSIPFTSDLLYFNTLTAGLVISEIMYNAPGSVDDDDLEFVEIYNNTSASIPIGGLRFADENGNSIILPTQDLAAGATLLIATNKAFADTFYSASFLDMGLPQTNVFGNGGELLSIFNTENGAIFSVDYDDTTAWPMADGDGPSLELIDPAGNINDGANWQAATNLVGQSEMNDVFATPGSYTPTSVSTPNISFDAQFTNVFEDANTATIDVSLDRTPTNNVTVNLTQLIGSSAILGTDYTITNNSLIFTPGGATTQSVSISILDDTTAAADVFVAFELTNTVNATLGSSNQHTLFIIDNDTQAPVAANVLNMSLLTSYPIAGSDPGAEIVAHDAASQRLFVMNSGEGQVEVLDFSNPAAIVPVISIDLSAQTIGLQAGDQVEGTSVTAQNGIVAAASYRVEDATGNELFAPGTVSFWDAATGNFISAVSIGVLPDMITFTPDGTKVLAANEGQPSDDYITDPDGSVSIIDISGGVANVTQANVTTATFTSFNGQEASLRTSGVRIFGPNASASQDFEPEYITISDDSQTAWVSLQENNAMARIDLGTGNVTNVFPFGFKDHSLPENALDLNNNLDFIFMANYPILGMYQPDAIEFYTSAGTNYIVTANEGDARDYGGYTEEARAGDNSYVLDPTAFPNQDVLRSEGLLDRINVTLANGDTDGDGDYDEIYVYGGRSFSIFNADTGALVYDSADLLERIVAADPTYGSIFNASNSNNTFKNRSDDKGPEPEGLTLKEINGSTYAFIGLERVGGLAVFDITNPAAPTFETYVNNRNATPGAPESGDLAPEGIIYVDAADNTTGNGLVVIANEESATIAVYQVPNDTATINDINSSKISYYPNPVKAGELVRLSQSTNVKIYDLSGRLIRAINETNEINTTGMQTGLYLISTDTNTFKLKVK